MSVKVFLGRLIVWTLLFAALRRIGVALFHTGLLDALRSTETGRVPAYEGHSLLWGALGHPAFLLAAVLWLLPLGRWLTLGWRELEVGRGLRPYAVTLGALLTWLCVFYDVHPYLGRIFVADRALMVAFCVGFAFRPLFVLPLLLQYLVFQSQGSVPIASYSPDLDMVLQLTFAVAAWIFLICLLRHWRLAAAVLLGLGLLGFVFAASPGFPRWRLLAAVVLAAGLARLLDWWEAEERGEVLLAGSLWFLLGNYLYAALYKLQISPRGFDWVWSNDAAHLLAYRFSQGWMRGLEPPSRQRLLEFAADWSPVFYGAVLLVELVVLSAGLGRRPTLAVLLGLSAFHLASCWLFGLFFWSWLASCLLLAYWVSRWPRASFPARPWLAAGWMLALPIFTQPPRPAWYETPFAVRMQLEAVGSSGRVYPVPWALLGPAHDFGAIPTFLIDAPVLGYSTLSLERLREQLAADPETALRWVESRGVRYYDAALARRFEAFVGQTFERYNRHPGRPDWAGFLRRPRKMPMPAPPGAYDFQEPIRRVRVTYQQQLFYGGEIYLLRDAVVLEIPIPLS